MRLVVPATSGATGGLRDEGAFEAGRGVTAYLSDPAKPGAQDRFLVVSGGLREAGALTGATPGTSALISTAGVGKAEDPRNPAVSR